MAWTCCIIWFLYVSECWCLARPEPVMHGQFQSFQYPQPYSPNQAERWYLHAPEGYQIQLTFTHLDIKDSAGCYLDSIKVLYDQRVLGKFCGQENSTYHPGKEPILSPGNRLILIFQANHSTSELQQHAGFSADYKHIASTVIDCGEPKPLLNGEVILISGTGNQYHSVVQYRCNEPFHPFLGGVNVNFTCEADGKWRPSHGAVTPRCVLVCGRPSKLISRVKRIIGGNVAPDYTIPWQVLVNMYNHQRGGGMVIADSWVLTAASLLTHSGEPVSNESVRIYMGLTDIVPLRVSPVYAASIHVHPEYNNPNGIKFNNDIALIKLQNPITFNSSIMPICLPTADATYNAGDVGLVSGFGIRGHIRRVPSTKLNYVSLRIVSQETCNNAFKVLKISTNTSVLSDNMFCAGLPEGGKDPCSGDAGGPFALKDDGLFWAAGIISWGVGCGKPGAYGVYTKVANYVHWIKKTVQEN